MRRTVWTGALCAAALVSFSANIATGQQGPKPAPIENRGLRYEALPSLDLTGQIEGMAGRQFRIRRLTVEPGGYSALHEHRDRPAILYNAAWGPGRRPRAARAFASTTRMSRASTARSSGAGKPTTSPACAPWR